MLLYGTETNTFHKEWKIIAIVLRVAKLLMSPSIFESESQKWAICAWFQFLPSTEMFDFRTKTLQITRWYKCYKSIQYVECFPWIWHFCVSVSIWFCFLSRAVNNRYLPSVLTEIDVLSVSKHKCDCWLLLLHASRTIAEFIAVRYLLWRLNDWFITFACEARGCLSIPKLAVFLHFHREKGNRRRLVIIASGWEFSSVIKTSL